MEISRVVVSAPGRICLFGEHQDYLGLPVIAAAISLRISVEARRRKDRIFNIELPDVNQADTFVPDRELAYRGKRDYLRSAVNVLRRRGVLFDHGWDVRITGRIPICAGCGSSSALVVAWTKFLLTIAGLHKTPEEVAKIAHEAEVVEFNEPGGMMDHYTSALGGVLYIKTGNPVVPMPLRARPRGFVLGDTLEKKDTVGTLRELREDAQAGLAILTRKVGECTYKDMSLKGIERCTDELPERVARRLRANVINRDITREAEELLSREDFAEQRLGKLLTRHHEMLRDGLGVSSERLEHLIDAAMGAGALGAKLNGSGQGGCMFAYAIGREAEVARAIEQVGGKAYVVEVDRGVTTIIGE